MRQPATRDCLVPGSQSKSKELVTVEQSVTLALVGKWFGPVHIGKYLIKTKAARQLHCLK